MTSLGNYAFRDCTALKSIDIPSTVTSIGNYVFYKCAALESLTFEDDASLEEIGTYAFYECTSLTSLSLPSSLTSIGSMAFSASGVVSAVIAENVTEIGTDAFYQCSSLNTIEYNATNCETAGSRQGPVFEECPNVESLTIGKNVTAIPAYIFAAYDGSDSNGDITEANAETGHFSGVTEVTIPTAVTTIGSMAFYGCGNLARVYSPNTTPAACGTGVFEGIKDAQDCELYVPVECTDTYTDYSGSSDDYAWNYFQTANTTEYCLPITVNATDDDGWVYATYYNGTYGYVMPEGVTGTTATVNDSDQLQFKWQYGEGSTVPAGTALLLKGDYETFYAWLSDKVEGAEAEGDTDDDVDTEDNWLHGSDTATDANGMTSKTQTDSGDGDYVYYKLAYKNSANLGFYWGADEGGAFSATAHKAWLAVPANKAEEIKITGFAFGDSVIDDGENEDTTGISSFEGDTENSGTADGMIYNMAGQRVNSMGHRGVYIVNGRKVAKKF